MPADTVQASFPVTLARDLQVYTGALSDGDSLLSVVGGTTVCRVPVWSLKTGMVSWWSGGEPAEPVSAGAEYSVAAGSSGFYWYNGGLWRKAPSYSSRHWSDLDGDVRFLKVDSVMDLGTDEVANARASLNIVTATTDTPGLVLAGGSSEGPCPVLVSPTDGRLSAPEARHDLYGTLLLDNTDPEHAAHSAASVQYTSALVAALDIQPAPTVATHSKPGLVLADSPVPDPETGYIGPFQVDSVGNVTIHRAQCGLNGERDPIAGLVLLSSPDIPADDSTPDPDLSPDIAASVEKVRKMVARAVSAQASVPAGEATLGSVMVPGEGCLRLIKSTTPSGDVPPQWAPGSVDVNPAGSSKHGAVAVSTAAALDAQDSIEVNGKSYKVVPTVRSVKNYVDNGLSGKLSLVDGKVPEENLPLATETDIGAVQVGDGLYVNSGRLSAKAAVPTVYDSYRNDLQQKAGVVYVCMSTDEQVVAGLRPVVPTVGKVRQMLEGTGGGGGSSTGGFKPWPRVALSAAADGTVPVPGVMWKMYDIADGALRLVAGTPTFTGFAEYAVLWTPGPGVASFQAATEGWQWGADTPDIVHGTTYVIRVANVAQRVMLACVQYSYIKS